MKLNTNNQWKDAKTIEEIDKKKNQIRNIEKVRDGLLKRKEELVHSFHLMKEMIKE